MCNVTLRYYEYYIHLYVPNCTAVLFIFSKNSNFRLHFFVPKQRWETAQTETTHRCFWVEPRPTPAFQPNIFADDDIGSRTGGISGYNSIVDMKLRHRLDTEEY